jgi:hypothetical protein
MRSAGPVHAIGAQPKLRVHAPGDRYEREADAVADRVTRGEAASPISRLSGGGPDASGAQGAVQRQARTSTEDEAPLQRQPIREEEDELQRQPIEEEEPVQMQAEEEEAIQMQAEEEEGPVQLQALDADEEPVQAQAVEDEEEAVQARGAGGAVSTQTAAAAMQQSGAGAPLPSSVRSTLETGMGRDFSGVRVHDGAAARQAADALNARAFTRGSDIYLGRGASPTDAHLMAHEATHVVQQSAVPARAKPAQRQPIREEEDELQRQPVEEEEPVQMQAEEEEAIQMQALDEEDTPVQRQDEGGGADNQEGGEATSGTEVHPGAQRLETGRLDPATNTIEFAQIRIPRFKNQDHRGALYAQKELRRKANYTRGSTNQRDIWRRDLNKQTIRERLQTMLRAAHGGEIPPGDQYVFRGFGNRYYIGTLDEIATELTTPNWGGRGTNPRFRFFHVDHIVELQIANWDAASWPNTLENMELLEAKKNMASGRIIQSNIVDKVEAFRRATDGHYGSVDQIKQQYDLKFNRAVGRGGPSVGARDYWKPSEIENADHIQSRRALEVTNLSDIGGGGVVRVLKSASGGFAVQFGWPDGQAEAMDITGRERRKLRPWRLLTKQFNTSAEGGDQLGSVTAEIPEGHDTYKPYRPAEPFRIQRLGGAQYAGHWDPEQLRRQTEALEKKGASPLTVERFDVTPEGLLAEGQLLPTVPLIGDANIRYRMLGDDFSLYKRFTADDFSFPGPVEVTQSSLTLSASTRRGLAVDGRVDVAVENVGTGYLEGGAGTAAGFHVTGGFDFDTELFSRAHIELGYHKPPDQEATFTGSGTLAIGRNKVRGIRSASIDVTVENESWTANGTVNPEMRGIEQGELSAAYEPETGFAIAGSLRLSGDVPGIRGGELTAGVTQREGGEGYKIRAEGTADLDIPGVDAAIDVSYDDGTFLARGSVGYERGMLSGRLTAGVTNQPLSEGGQPTGEPPASPNAPLRAFGGGQVTIQIAPWLEGSIGVQLLANGEVEVTGEVGLPSTIELFPERRYEKRLFQIGIDIPIVGVAVAGQRIGIFATVSGGLDASAGIGPGELRDARLSVTYNPDREQDTTVTGHALFVVPAHAGIRLFVRGGLGVGIPIVSAEAGLEVGGELGLQGAAEAEADVNWTPQTGIVLHAEGRIFAEPTFVFDLSGYVSVTADLLLTTIDLYDERFRFASFEWGSGLRVGIIFPVDYREGEPFDLSLDDIEFVYPQINARALLSDLVDEVV